jgi:hypothetical protein
MPGVSGPIISGARFAWFSVAKETEIDATGAAAIIRLLMVHTPSKAGLAGGLGVSVTRRKDRRRVERGAQGRVATLSSKTAATADVNKPQFSSRIAVPNKYWFDVAEVSISTAGKSQ